MAERKGNRRSQGTGSIFYDETLGYWTAQLMVGHTEKGRPRYVRARKRSEADAVKALNEMLARHTLGIQVEQSGQTVGRYLDYWLEEHIRKHKEPKTYRTYEQMVRLYLKPSLGHLRLAKLTAPQIQALINRLTVEGGAKDESGRGTPLSPKTVRDARGVLRSALQTAWRESLIRENPALKVTVPKAEQREAVYLAAEEAVRLIESSRAHYLGPMIEVAVMTGLRLGEVTGLTWSDLDLDLATLRVRRQLQKVEGEFVLKSLKTRNSKRTLSLPTQGIDALRDQRARQLVMEAERKGKGPFNPLGLVFTNPEGKPLDGPNVDDSLKILCRKAKVREVSFHKLRHTAATHLASAGVPLAVVKDVLGHSAIGLTANLYSHAVPAALQQASETMSRLMREASSRGGGTEGS